MADLDQKLAQRVREVREEMGLSQSDLAARMKERGHTGFQQQTVARIESGNRKVTYGEAVDIAVAMNHTPEGLVGAPGEDALVAKGSHISKASSALTGATAEYVLSLFGFVMTADEIEAPLRANQQKYLESLFRQLTPAMLTLDAGTVLKAAMSRAKVDRPGPYLARLIQAIDRDESALVALKKCHGKSKDNG